MEVVEIAQLIMTIGMVAAILLFAWVGNKDAVLGLIGLLFTKYGIEALVKHRKAKKAKHRKKKK